VKLIVIRLFDETGIEQRVATLLSSREESRYTCIAWEPHIQQRMRSCGISCELFEDLIEDAIDRESWAAAHRACKAFANVVGEHNDLQYRGIPLFECFPDDLWFFIAFSRVCDLLSEKGYSVAIFLLKRYFPDFRSSKVKTYFYGGSFKSRAKAAAWLLLTNHWLAALLPRLLISASRSMLSALRKDLPPGVNRRAPSPDGEQQKTAFFAVGYSSDFPEFFARPVYSIVEECMVSGFRPIVIAETPHLKRIFNSRMRGPLVFSSHFSLSASIVWLSMVPALNRLLAHFERSLGKSNNHDRLGSELLGRYLRYITPSICLQSLQYILTLDSLFRRLAPSVVLIMPDLFLFGRTAAKVARKYRIPSLTVVPGIVGDHPAYGMVFADRIAVSGSGVKRVYLKRGISPERVVVTGIPNLSLRRSATEPTARGSPKKTVLYVTENINFTATRQAIQATVNAARRIGDTKVIVKVHPREDLRPYELLAEEVGSNGLQVVKDVDLRSLIESSDLVIVNVSLVGLEAMVLGKPVVVVNFTRRPEVIPYAAEGAALLAKTPKDVECSIRTALFDSRARRSMHEKAEKFISQYASGADGKANRRIVELMEKMSANAV